MAKKVVGQIKLQLPGGQATPAPPVGPALGQHGLNIMDFCKAFNARTQKRAGHHHPGRHHGVRRPDLQLHHQDPAGVVPAAPGGRARQGLGRAEPGQGRRRSRWRQVEEIAKTKMPDLNTEYARGGGPDHSRDRTVDGHRGAGLRRWPMARKGKKYRDAAARVERRPYPIDEAIELVRESAYAKLRRDRRGVDAARGQPAPRRPDGPRHRGAAARHRQDPKRAGGVRGRGPEGRRGGRCRLRPDRRRGDRQDPGRLARVRRDGGHAGHDAQPVQGGPGARSSRADAEPEVGHGDHGRRRRRSRTSRPVGSSSGSTRPRSSTRRWARCRSATDKLVENTRSFVDAVQKAKPSTAKGRYVHTVYLCSTMGPGVQVDLVSLDVK